MIAYIANPLVQVSDPDRALNDFYVKALGFEQRAAAPAGAGSRWIEVARPAASAEDDHPRPRSAPAPRAPGGPLRRYLVFGTSDIQATYRQLRARGVTFTEPPTPQPQGMLQAQFIDHDGNGFVLVQP